MKKYNYQICETSEMLTIFKKEYEQATGDTLSVPIDYLKEASRVVNFCVNDQILAGFVINGNTNNLRYLSTGVLEEEDKLNVLDNFFTA